MALSTKRPGTRPIGLQAFLGPGSVAVVGATDSPGKVGQAVMQNLLAAGFAGEIYPVNQARAEIAGPRAHRSLSSLPEIPVLPAIATPAATGPAVIEECAALGVPAAIIVSAGFREAGPEGKKLEQQILSTVRRGGMRVVGPNCLGIMSPSTHLNATF